MSEMSQREYWAEVESIVDTIITESRADDLDRDDVMDRLHETIDGHEWVIYTAYNFDVLRHSDNDDYSVIHFGADSVVNDAGLNTAALAYGALYGDVSDKLWQRVEDCTCGGEDDCEDCGGLGWVDSEAAS